MNRLINGDCLKELPLLEEESVDLVYMDPPFFTQRDWGEFDDRWDGLESYVMHMRVSAEACRRVLKPTGSLYLHCDPTASHYLKVMLDAVFGRGNFRNEVVWCYRFGAGGKKQFRRKHDTLLFYNKGKKWTFNADAVSTPARSAWAGQSGIKNVVETDWWDIPSINNKERCGYPTQKPLALLHRIISASSNPGDLVLDPMCGSGTTLVAAAQLGRNYIGMDANINAVELARERLLETTT